MLSHGVQGWRSSQHCSGVVTGQHRSLTYLSGDALTDSRDCLGPGGQRYPHEEVDKFVRQQSGVRGGSSRQGRAMNLGNLQLYLQNLSVDARLIIELPIIGYLYV